MPIFRVKSVKNLHRPKKNYTDAVRGVRDKYEVCQYQHDQCLKIDTFQLNEAYEEVDEQKRDVAQWKKKTQKANSKDVVYDELTTFV